MKIMMVLFTSIVTSVLKYCGNYAGIIYLYLKSIMKTTQGYIYVTVLRKLNRCYLYVKVL